MNSNNTKSAWIVSADMGYGHQRAVYPLKDYAEEAIINVGSAGASPKSEVKAWKRVLGTYEFISRAKSIPLIGSTLFNLLDAFMHIPSFYPMRNLSNTTFQVNLLESSIKNGLCSGMMDKVRTKNLPLITSFYAPAIAADMGGMDKIYCIICDADLNRVWVSKYPWDSRIEYFAPCGKAAHRLRAYGVPDDKIHLSGFPLPVGLTGGKDLSILKRNLARRLKDLDPSGKFWQRHEKNIIHFLGEENCSVVKEGVLTILYSVGGAGAQREIGGKIANSLKKKILNGEVRLILSAGIKEQVHNYFLDIKNETAPDSEYLQIIFDENLYKYFDKFNAALNETDILWTKPSELSFYCGLGLPIMMTSALGSQEKFNNKWLIEIQAGIKQDNPEYTDQWLYYMLNRGIVAEAAWAGFLKARKLGTYNIIETIETGKMTTESSPIIR